VVQEHWAAMGPLLDMGSRGIVQITGEYLAGLAKEFHRPHILTGATFNSIGPSGKGPVFRSGYGEWSVEIGVETQQALFLEWGFLHVNSGRFIRYPFMIPAADAIKPMFTDAMTQLVQVAGRRRVFTNPIANSTAALGTFRTSLYSFSKAVGDVRILGVGGMNKARGAALQGAKITGDLESIMRSALTTRVFRRVVGRWVSGRLSAQRSAVVRGPNTAFAASGQRILNRFSGFTVGHGFGEL